MTLEVAALAFLYVMLPIIIYAIVRMAQAINDIRTLSAIRWNLQREENNLIADRITQYMPQGVTLQQIKSELSDHLQQHAARDMKQAGTLNTTDYPNLHGPVSPGGKWADLQSETEAIDGDQIV